ncbi:transposase [Acinetobacter bohemicus]|uniref:transposase n=1 Tax=Acinetobacter bohemicus TaxID=1435036 RepID=UPI004042F5BC
MHTFKVQAMIHYKTQQILSLCSSHGAVHDFELFKHNLNQIPSGAFILADKGYFLYSSAPISQKIII